MVIVAGHITVEPEQRDSYVASCKRVVEQGRQAAGCLDFAITADPLDPGRVNIFERWESQAAVKSFRRRAPRTKQARRHAPGIGSRVRHRRHTVLTREAVSPVLRPLPFVEQPPRPAGNGVSPDSLISS